MPDLDAVRRRPALSLAATVAAVAVLMTVGFQLGEGLSEPVGHALSHVFVGVPVAVLVWFVVRSWPPARVVRPGRLARRLVVVGFSGIVVGQVLEVLGARVDEPDAATWEGVAHTAGMVVTNLSLLVAVIGGALAMVAAARDGAVPRWAAGLVVAVLVVAFGIMTFGGPIPR
ncbi:MAG: hypothetical protein KY457_10235 [Actinobacteria bacterium]|nr:hypothetical protein [Actinomycetota bacterium]